MHKNILPIFIIAAIFEIIFLGLAFYYHQIYLANSNSEIANLIGTISTEYPAVDPANLIHNLSADNSEAGAKILQQFGYTPSDFAAPSSANFYSSILLAGSIIIFVATLAFAIYFYFYDSRRRQKIHQFIDYVQKLNQQIYDLKIDTNTESELSQLSNELYKITVTLKESAEHDRAMRQNLETALADISHQLKTPLTSLQIALDNLSDPEMPPKVRTDFLQASSQQVAAMSRLVTTLLNLAKFDSGTIKLSRRCQPISEILTQVSQNLEILADLKNVKLELCGDLSAKVELDAHWQTEALVNVIKNSIEHSPPNSTVKISVEQTSLYTRLTIRDRGPGIASHDLPHIFERFYKTTASATNVGIGLAFAKSIIAADYGQIRAKSSSDGTTFIITYFAQSNTTRLS